MGASHRSRMKFVKLCDFPIFIVSTITCIYIYGVFIKITANCLCVLGVTRKHVKLLLLLLTTSSHKKGICELFSSPK